MGKEQNISDGCRSRNNAPVEKWEEVGQCTARTTGRDRKGRGRMLDKDASSCMDYTMAGNVNRLLWWISTAKNVKIPRETIP